MGINDAGKNKPLDEKDISTSTGEHKEKTKNNGKPEKNRWKFLIPLGVLLLGLLIRIIMILPLSQQVDILYRWAAQSNLISHPDLGFEHTYLLYRNSSCPPFYYYVSLILWKMLTLSKQLLSSANLSEIAWEMIRSLILKSPVILSDIGISLIIYFLVKKKLGDHNKGVVAGSLYFLSPPVIFSGVDRPQILSVTLFLIMLSLALYYSRGKIKILSGIAYAGAVLNSPHPILILPFVVIVLAEGIKKKKYTIPAVTLIVFFLALFFMGGAYSNYTFKPPDVENLKNVNLPPTIFQPVEGKNAEFFPFALVYRNNFSSSHVTNPAFNFWTITGLLQDDSVVSTEVGNLKITRRILGLFLATFFLIVIFGLKFLSKKNRLANSLILFLLFFFTLFAFLTRMSDHYLLLVFPFLCCLFFLDYRSRVAWYWLTLSFMVNLFYTNHFNLNPEVTTTVPAQMHIVSALNLIVFLGLVYSFRMAIEEDNLRESSENLKKKLFEKMPTLARIQDWMLVPQNQQLLALLLVSFLIRIWRIGIPADINFDEKYYVPIARDYFYSISAPVEQASHPPLATYFIGIGIGLFGDNPFGWRIISLLFGTAMIAVIYYFARALFKKHPPAFFAAFLLSFDFLHFVHSRLGMLDIYSSFFNLCSYYLFYLYIEKGKKKHLTGLAVTLALGLACKWTTVFTIAGIISLVIAGKIAGMIWKNRFKFGQVLRKTPVTAIVAALLLIPLLFQILIFLPLYNGSVPAVVDKISNLLSYHENLIGEDKISSPWWSWLFIINPIQYTRGTIGTPKMMQEGPFFIVKLKEYDASEKFAVTGMGNPIVWWLAIPAFIAALFLAYKKRNPAAAYACMPFIFQFLPWAFAKRITYLFYMIDIIPYICVILAFCLYYIYRTGKIGKTVVQLYLGLVALSFILFYPLLSALSLPPGIYRMYRIFDFWQFK